MFLKEVIKSADILFYLQVLEIDLWLLSCMAVIVVHLLWRGDVDVLSLAHGRELDMVVGAHH